MTERKRLSAAISRYSSAALNQYAATLRREQGEISPAQSTTLYDVATCLGVPPGQILNLDELMAIEGEQPQ